MIKNTKPTCNTKDCWASHSGRGLLYATKTFESYRPLSHETSSFSLPPNKFGCLMQRLFQKRSWAIQITPLRENQPIPLTPKAQTQHKFKILPFRFNQESLTSQLPVKMDCQYSYLGENAKITNTRIIQKLKQLKAHKSKLELKEKPRMTLK